MRGAAKGREALPETHVQKEQKMTRKKAYKICDQMTEQQMLQYISDNVSDHDRRSFLTAFVAAHMAQNAGEKQ